MDLLNNTKVEKIRRPVRVLQFGEGNFLRGFADYMIDIANEKGYFHGDVVIVKPTESYGNVEYFKQQDCRYTVTLRGIVNGKEKQETRVITSIADIVDPYREYNKYSELAAMDTLRFLISNTTEAGIVYDETDRLDMEPPRSYPGKLTKFLYERFRHFEGDIQKGLIILPLELIEENGIQLKNIVRKLGTLWGLENAFLQWLEEACIFCNTLVDRIITGFPQEEAEAIWRRLGYQDNLLVAGEPFGLWVIESEKSIEEEFPLHRAGQPVVFTGDQTPYRLRKVRILNGAHSSFAPASYLAGNDFVLESMQDEDIREFVDAAVQKEIIPALNLPEKETLAFAKSVMDRFENPYNKHSLLAIALNSIVKWKVRILPSIVEFLEKNGFLPVHLTFSLAALIQFYSGGELREGVLLARRGEEEYPVHDDKEVLEFFLRHAKEEPEQLVPRFLAREDFWERDLNDIPGFPEKVTGYLRDIRTGGMRNAIRKANEDSVRHSKR